MRVAIIGTGNIARMHARFYRDATKAPMELVACADIVEASRQKFASDYGISNTYTDYREMLQKEKPDLVSICTWPGQHCEMTLAAIEVKPKGIICEKYIAPTLAEGDTMIAAAHAAGVTLSIDHQLRCMPQFVQAREMITTGKLGTIKRVVGYCTPGFLTESATHTVDIMRYIMGDEPISWVIGQIDRRSNQIKYGEPVEDMSFGYWSWESGARGSIETGIIYKGDGYHHIIVSGTEGELETWYSGDTLLRVRTNGAWKVIELEPTPNPVDEMVMALEEGRPHKSSGEQGLATHEVLMAVYESSRRRGVVELPLQYRGNPFKDMIEQGMI